MVTTVYGISLISPPLKSPSKTTSLKCGHATHYIIQPTYFVLKGGCQAEYCFG